MSWKDKYDSINHTWDGDNICFGGHYNTQELREIIEKDNWDEPKDWEAGMHIYIRFQLVSDENGELTNGWMVLSDKPKFMSGCIEATEMNSIVQSSKESQK